MAIRIKRVKKTRQVGIALEKKVVALLRRRNRTLATAESCTGGFLAHRITLVPGSSEVFREGWVTYSNMAKSKALGVPGQMEDPRLQDAVSRVIAAGAKHQVPVGMFCGNVESSHDWVSRGAGFTVIDGDLGFLAAGAKLLLANARVAAEAPAG